jgi:ribulose-phosphate 3-epimerase
MKISASIYSNKNKKFNDLIKELDLFNVDFFHIDCNDDLSVFNDIEVIRKNSITPIDLHIISDKPEKYYSGIIKNNIELVTFQFENLTKNIEIPSDISSKFGLALMTDTPIEVFDDFADRFSFVLFMTTTPGESGGKFDKRNFDKIKEFKKKYPEKFAHVDGGVNDEVAFVLRSLGVSCAVSGCSGPLILDTFQATFSNSAIF